MAIFKKLAAAAAVASVAFSLFSGAAETVYLHAALSTIMERLGSEDASRPLYTKASELYYARQSLYEAARFRVDTDGKRIDDVAREIRDMLCA